MNNGKVCNAATNTTSTMRCYMCGQTSKDFNDLNKKTTESRKALKFGHQHCTQESDFLNPCCIHRIKYQLKNSKQEQKKIKKIVAETKQKIQNAFNDELGLLVDIP